MDIARSLCGLGYTITADSVPDEPEEWGATEWIAWHKRLKARYGLEQANEKWLIAFNDQPWYDYDLNFMQYNCQSLKYFAENGIPSDALARLKCGIDDVVGGSGDVLTDVADGATGLSEGVVNTAGVLKTVVPILLLGIAVGGSYYVYKNYIKGNKELPLGLKIKA